MRSPVPLDEPGQTFLVDPDRDPCHIPSGTEDRRQAASTMVQEILSRCSQDAEDIAKRFGVSLTTVDNWRLGKSAPTGRTYADLHQYWNFHMSAKGTGKPATPAWRKD